MPVKVVSLSSVGPFRPISDDLPFCKGIPGIDKCLIAAVTSSKDLKTLGATMEHIIQPGVPFDYEWEYDELSYVIAGQVKMIIEGKTHVANAGDIIVVAKGTKGQVEVPVCSSTLSIMDAPWDVTCERLIKAAEEAEK